MLWFLSIFKCFFYSFSFFAFFLCIFRPSPSSSYTLFPSSSHSSYFSSALPCLPIFLLHRHLFSVQSFFSLLPSLYLLSLPCFSFFASSSLFTPSSSSSSISSFYSFHSSSFCQFLAISSLPSSSSLRLSPGLPHLPSLPSLP